MQEEQIESEKREYLVTTMTYEGKPISTGIVVSDEDNETFFWNQRMQTDPKLDVNIQYLGIQKEPSRLKKIEKL